MSLILLLLHTDLLCMHNISLHVAYLYFCPGCNQRYQTANMCTFVAGRFKSTVTERVDHTNGSSRLADGFWLGNVQIPGWLWREEGQGDVVQGTALPPKTSLSCGNEPFWDVPYQRLYRKRCIYYPALILTISFWTSIRFWLLWLSVPMQRLKLLPPHIYI